MATIQRSATNTAGFVPTYWAQRALDVLRSMIVLPQLVAKDVDFDNSFKTGQTLNIPYPGTFTAQDKVEGTPVTPQTPTGGATVALTLNKHKIVGISVEDFTEAQANVDLMDTYLNPAIIAIAEQFERDSWLTLMGCGTIAAEGTPGTDVTAALIRKGMQRLNEAKSPAANRSIVVSAKDQAAILGDSNLATLLAYSQPQAVYNGSLGRLYGLDILWSQLAPSGYRLVITATGGTFTAIYGGQTSGNVAFNATAATLQTAIAALSSVGAGKVSVSGPTGGPFNVVFDASLVGTLTADATNLTGGAHTAVPTAAQKNVALHKNAMIYAVREFKPSAAGVESAQASDPESGLSIRVSKQYDINAVADRLNVDILYGMTVLRSDQAVILDA